MMEYTFLPVSSRQEGLPHHTALLWKSSKYIMGHESLVYGCIIGTQWKIEDPKRLHHINRHSIVTLPEHDDWPFLTKKMFAISGDSVQEGTYRSQIIHFGGTLSGDSGQEGTYRSQIIHFGGTFKAIEWEWDKWLEKFEELLKKLYWDEVNLHLRTELVGNYNYQYLPKNYLEVIYHTECPQPARQWIFTGGPRRFSTSGPEYENSENLTWVYEGQTWKIQS